MDTRKLGTHGNRWHDSTMCNWLRFYLIAMLSSSEALTVTFRISLWDILLRLIRCKVTQNKPWFMKINLSWWSWGLWGSDEIWGKGVGSTSSIIAHYVWRFTHLYGINRSNQLLFIHLHHIINIFEPHDDCSMHHKGQFFLTFCRIS